jgi:hypothetical protein
MPAAFFGKDLTFTNPTGCDPSKLGFGDLARRRTGSNENEQRTPDSHYECSWDRRDDLLELEKRSDPGGEIDLFSLGGNNRFGSPTRPDSSWRDVTSSDLEIYSISPAEARMISWTTRINEFFYFYLSFTGKSAFQTLILGYTLRTPVPEGAPKCEISGIDPSDLERSFSHAAG